MCMYIELTVEARQNAYQSDENVLKYLGNGHQQKLVDVMSMTAQDLHILLKIDML